MPIGAVAANTLSIKATHSETEKPSILKINKVSNTLLKPTIQPERKILTDGTRWALPEISAFKNGLEEHQWKNRPPIAECTKSVLIENKNTKSEKVSEFSSEIMLAFERNVDDTSPTYIKEIDEYLKLSCSYITQKRQPDWKIFNKETSLMPRIIEGMNISTPGLNLSLFESVDDMINDLERKGEYHGRYIFSEFSICPHYLFADVSLRPGQAASVLILNTVFPWSSGTHHLCKEFRECWDRSSLPALNVSLINMHMQKSPNDCLIYGVSFAKEALEHSELFTSWHDAQRGNGGPLPYLTPGKDIFKFETEYYSKIYIPDARDTKFDKHVYPFFDGISMNLCPTSMLPADFIKHSNSRAVLDNYMKHILSVEDKSTRDMLSEKLDLYEDRLTEDGHRKYLVSIEHERLDIIAKFMNNWFANKKI